MNGSSVTSSERLQLLAMGWHCEEEFGKICFTLGLFCTKWKNVAVHFEGRLAAESGKTSTESFLLVLFHTPVLLQQLKGSTFSVL